MKDTMKRAKAKAARELLTFQSSVDEDGGEVVVAVHQIDVSRGEADCQQWFLAVH